MSFKGEMQSIVEPVKAAIHESLRDEISTIVSEKIKPLNDQVDKLRCENHQLRMQLDELEQYGRRPLVRISGIRETNGEDPKVKILEVIIKTGIDLCPDDIIIPHRVGKPRSKPRQIIVRLHSVDTKFSLLIKICKEAWKTLRNLEHSHQRRSVQIPGQNNHPY